MVNRFIVFSFCEYLTHRNGVMTSPAKQTKIDFHIEKIVPTDNTEAAN